MIDFAPIRRAAFVGACIGAADGASVAIATRFAQGAPGALTLVLLAALGGLILASGLSVVSLGAQRVMRRRIPGWIDAPLVAAVMLVYTLPASAAWASPVAAWWVAAGLVGTACWAWLEEHRRVWANGVALVAFGLPLGVAVSGTWAVPPVTPARGASVVLVTVEGLRRDHVGVYGGFELTPSLDRFAGEAAVFFDATTPSADPVVAHQALFSGVHPLHTSVSDAIAARNPASVVQTLYDAGWATGAFVSSARVGVDTGLHRGFEVFEDSLVTAPSGLFRIRSFQDFRSFLALMLPWRWRAELDSRDGWETVSAFSRWLRRQPGPFFAWVHLDAPREPFTPHGMRGFADNGAVGNPSVDHARLLRDARMPDAPETAALIRLYQEEVAYTDALIGIVVDAVASMASDRDVVVIVAGTSGMMLGEHRIFFDQRGVHEDLIRIPLMIRGPGLTPQRVMNPVRLYDIAPTILSAASIPVAASLEGVDLADVASGRRGRALPSVILGRGATTFADSPLIAVRADGRKVVLDLSSQDIWGVDLDADPSERELIRNPDWLYEHVEALRPDVLLLRQQIGANSN